MTLLDDFHAHSDRIAVKWLHYFPVYERHFHRYVGRPALFVEIGCGSGGSLQLWKRYLGAHARIVGLDIQPGCKQFEEEQISVRIGHQADFDFLKNIIDEFGVPDIVLDDGSHNMSDICRTFAFLYPKISSSGIYFVEDLHTAYWEEYGGGLKREGTFIEICKGLIDELNADWTREGPGPTDFTRSTLSMHIYDSLAVFERGQLLTKQAVTSGHR